MLSNLIKSTIRNILKYKSYTLINIFGLSIGLTCAILILLWIQGELSMDNYHLKADRICQAYLKGTQDDITSFQPTVSPAIAVILKTEYPEIEETVRIGSLDEVVLKAGEKRILESGGIAADPSIFNVLSFSRIEGNLESALKNPRSIVLTQSLARKYFGESQVIGRVIRMDNRFDFEVTAVIQDLPPNTYRSFDFIVPFVFLKDTGQDIIGEPFFPCNYITYVLLKPGISQDQLSQKISQRIFSSSEVISFEIILKPFREAYFEDTGGKMKIAVLSLVAFLILLIGCINYTNLATARSTSRAREIGIRKVSGSNRSQIAFQFLGESVLITVAAACLAVIMAHLILKSFNELTGKSISMKLLDFSFLGWLIGVIFITGLLAGFYPALFLSRFHPLKVLKQQTHFSKRGLLRKLLIVVQFIFSIIFIIATLIMTRQMRYSENYNLGVNEDNVIYIRLEGDIENRLDPLRHELLSNPQITSVATASNLPTAIRSGSYFSWGRENEVGRRICETTVDYDFLDVFGLEMAEGRFFMKQFPGDIHESIVVNEAAIREAGLKNAVGKPFYYMDRYYTLIGVVKDFQNNKTLTRLPDPLSFRLNISGNPLLFIKINPQLKDTRTVTETVHWIFATCNRFSPERPLNVQFLSDYSFEFERDMLLVRKILLYSTTMAILISCLGLFGLSAFLNEQRTKEIGIRKVLGASVSRLLIQSSREFSQWVLLSNLIAWPIAWFVMNRWLQNYAYRISIGWWIFALSGGTALLIAFITVSFHAIKAATANPVDSLRYE
jgi:putative ABC transport system permease protein